jgi:hypothetical protein
MSLMNPAPVVWEMDDFRVNDGQNENDDMLTWSNIEFVETWGWSVSVYSHLNLDCSQSPTKSSILLLSVTTGSNNNSNTEPQQNNLRL